MLSFLKHVLGKKPTTEEIREQIKEESVLPHADDVGASREEQAQASGEEAGVVTSLSLHESWEARLSAQEKYALSFIAQELAPLPKGKISLVGTSLAPHEEGLEVTAFVRNSADHPVRLGKMNLVILLGEEQLFARQSFDLAELGEIPPRSARPWSFVFTREHFLLVNVMLANWKLAFEQAQKKMVLPQKLELEESWIKALGDEQKQAFIELAKRLPALKEGEVNVQSVQIRRQADGALHVILLFRNGSNQALTFPKLPLAIYDATGEKAAEGLFELGSFVVNPGTSKPWLFIFPRESVLKADADFSRWKASVPRV